MTAWLQRQARSLRAFCVAVLCGALAACATPGPADGDGEAGVFSRVGRFALRVESPAGKQEAVQGGFAWRDDGRALRLDLANPLGATLARVEAGRGGAVLTRSDGSQTAAADPDALVAEVLGSDVPVSGLRDWLRGRVDDGRASDLQRDESGRPERFVQDGWLARLSRYDEEGPRLLQLERRQSGERINVRLVVD